MWEVVGLKSVVLWEITGTGFPKCVCRQPSTQVHSRTVESCTLTVLFISAALLKFWAILADALMRQVNFCLYIKEGSEMERVAPGGRKETEKQDGNLRFPDLNVTAYYCHCRSAFISEPLGRFSGTGALMLQRGLSQTLKQAKISGLKTKHPHKKGSLAHRACSCRFSTCLAPPAAWGLSTRVLAQQPLPGCCPVSVWAGSYGDHHQQPGGKVTGTEPQAVCSPSSLLPALGVGKGCCN